MFTDIILKLTLAGMFIAIAYIAYLIGYAKGLKESFKTIKREDKNGLR